MTIIYLTTASSSPFARPVDWDNNNNTIEALGGGGGGLDSFGGGGGGAYALLTNYTLPSSAFFTVGVKGASDSDGSDTTFDSGNLLAKAGQGATNSGAGGDSASCAPVTGAVSGFNGEIENGGLPGANLGASYGGGGNASGSQEGEDGVIKITYTPLAGDVTAPTVPSGLNATAKTETTFTLGWTASTDAVGVTGYKIYKDTVYLASSASTSYNVTGLTAATSYSWTVLAYDAATNESAQSSPLVVVMNPNGPDLAKNFNGLAIASVKNVNGLLSASVKNKNGLAS